MKCCSDLKAFPQVPSLLPCPWKLFQHRFPLRVHQSRAGKLVQVESAGPTARVSDSVGLEWGLRIHLKRVPRKFSSCCSKDHTLRTKSKEEGGQERKNKEESEREVRSEGERDRPWFVLKGPWAEEYRWPLDVASRSYRQRAAKSIADQNRFFKADICDEATSPTATSSLATLAFLAFPTSFTNCSLHFIFA